MVANYITAGRLGLFGVFLYVGRQVGFHLAWPWFLLAWGLDAIDGLVARSLHEESRFGFLFDKTVDRVILIGTGAYLLAGRAVPPIIFLLFTKDMLLLPALFLHWVTHTKIQSAGASGKITAFLQGVGLLWFLLQWPFVMFVTLVVAVIGLITAGMYWFRVAPLLFGRAEKIKKTGDRVISLNEATPAHDVAVPGTHGCRCSGTGHCSCTDA